MVSKKNLGLESACSELQFETDSVEQEVNNLLRAAVGNTRQE